MADLERERQREIAKIVDERVKEKLPGEVNRAVDGMSSFRRLKRTGWLGATVLAAAVVTGGLVSFDQGTQQGKQRGAQDERGRLFPRGELTPALRDKLATAKHSVVDIQGWTAARLKETKLLAVPDFPFPIPEGQPDPGTGPSKRKWVAVRQEGIYLPREEDDTVGDLTSDLNTANTAAGGIDSSLGFKPGDISEFLEAELASLRETGQSIFQAGHVITSHQVEIDGITNGIAIGRTAPTEPISYITFDAAKEALLPPGVSAGGFIIAK